MNFDHKAISRLSEPLYITQEHLDKFEPRKMLMQAVSNYDQDAYLVQ